MPSAPSQACIACPVSASGRPDAKPSTVYRAEAGGPIEARAGCCAADGRRGHARHSRSALTPARSRKREGSADRQWRMSPPTRAAAPAFGPDDFRAALAHVRDRRDHRQTALDAAGAPIGLTGELLQTRSRSTAAGALEPVAAGRLDAGLRARLRTTRSHPLPPASTRWRSASRARRSIASMGVDFRAGASGRACCSMAPPPSSSASTAAATKRATTSSSSARSSASTRREGAQPPHLSRRPLLHRACRCSREPTFSRRRCRVAARRRRTSRCSRRWPWRLALKT